MLLQAATRLVLAPMARLALTIDGRDNVPRTGPVILAANHLSFIDSLIIPLASPRSVAFLAKAEYFEGGGLRGRATRAGLTAIDAIPVRRDDARAAQSSLDTALSVLADGRAFGIHPEGTRSRDGRLYRGRTGVAWLALASAAPVVPVAVIGTDRVQPIGKRMPRPGRITVRFGAPLRTLEPPDRNPGRARRMVTDEIMEAIAALSGQAMADAYNPVSPVDAA